MSDTNPPEDGAPPQSAALPPTENAVPPRYAQSRPGEGAPPGYRNPAEAKNWMNVTSLVLSLSGLLFGVTAIGGIVFGHLGLSAVKRGEANNRSVGLAGLIVGYALTGLFLLVAIAGVAFLAFIVSECGGDDPASWCNEGFVRLVTMN